MTITELLEKIRSSETTAKDAEWLMDGLSYIMPSVCECPSPHDKKVTIDPSTHFGNCQWSIAFKD